MSRTVILRRGMLLLIGSLVLCIASWAGAQENLEKGKTAAQLYASDCAICHKSPQSLKAPMIFGLESFLREHYTASRESAAAIASYLNGLKKPEPPRGRAAKRTSQAKPSKQTPSESKGDDFPLDTAQRAMKASGDKAGERLTSRSQTCLSPTRQSILGDPPPSLATRDGLASRAATSFDTNAAADLNAHI